MLVLGRYTGQLEPRRYCDTVHLVQRYIINTKHMVNLVRGQMFLRHKAHGPGFQKILGKILSLA